MKKNVQLSHQNYKTSNKKFPLSLIANDMRDPLNVGSLFRLCDALGIEKLYLCGDTPIPPNSKINKTARSTVKYVAYEMHANAETLVASLKDSDALIISLEISSSSVPINSKTLTEMLTSKRPVYLILGSENTGISGNLLCLSEITVHIPMFGKNSSMNIVSAASIACFMISREISGHL